MTQHECTMKDPLTKSIEGIKTQNRWFMGIFGGAIILLLVGFGSQQASSTVVHEQVDKINKDYLPYFAFQYIVDSNNKLIGIINGIESKDDIKYQQAIKEWSELQQEIIKQAGYNKRGVTTSKGGSI
jgi:hypothetical protein